MILKSEQKEAVESLLKGREVYGVLPTGFGKSLMYQLFVLAKNTESFQLAKCFSRTPHNYPFLSAQKHCGRADNIE